MAATESVTIKLTAAPIPTLTKLSVKKAPAAGGTTVLLTGTGLSETTAVRFGAVNATFEVLSATSVRAVAPPSTSGVTQVTVTTAGGTSATSKKTQFKFLNPTVSAVSPASGPAAGGANVEITGSGFSPGNGTTTVLFGKTPATSVVCTSTTACSLTTPTGKSGSAVDVIAAVGKAKSKKTSADRYGFV